MLASSLDADFRVYMRKMVELEQRNTKAGHRLRRPRRDTEGIASMPSKSTATIRNCEYCGTEFRTRPSQIAKGRGRFCSYACRGAATWALREVHHCAHCGKLLRLTTARAKHGEKHYCSASCQHADSQVDRVECTCQHCGRHFWTRPSRVESGHGRYCSNACKYAARGEDVTGRFWAKVDKTHPAGCWLWTGSHSAPGYGHFMTPDGPKGAHRFAYELTKGPIPEGLQLDHLCRNPACVNPDHLEAVTPRENYLRGYGIPAINARKTHCKRGHEFTPENTYQRPDGGRDCRACMHIRQQRYARLRAE